MTRTTVPSLYPYSNTECDRRSGRWGAKASEQVDQSNDLNPISARDSAIDLAEDLTKELTIDLAKDLTIHLAKM